MLRVCLLRLKPVTVVRNRVGVFPLHLDPPTLEHREIVRSLLDDPNLALEKIILLPHTQYDVPLQHSLHLAAMATLGFAGLDRVEVDLSSLEHNETDMPQVGELLHELGSTKSTLIHWLPGVQFMHRYRDCAAILAQYRVVLLQPKSYVITSDDRAALPRGHRLRMVTKTGGNAVRRMLFEGTKDPHQLLHPMVMKYVESHGLYHDFRKRTRNFFGTSYSHRAGGSCNQGGGTKAGSVGTVALEGTAPRLELIYDPRNVLAQQIYASLRGFQVRKGEQPDLLVPIGGDGWMMKAIRKHWRRFIPFFGVNAGHLGYLLNDSATISELISAPLKLYQLPMLYCRTELEVKRPMFPSSCEGGEDCDGAGGTPMTIPQLTAAEEQKLLARPPAGPYTDGIDAIEAYDDESSNVSKKIVAHASDPTKCIVTREDLAFNDAWIERATGQTAKMNVKVNGVTRLAEVRGDGVLVSTGAGSTAYALALGASPLPVSAPMLQLVGNNCLSPARWKPVHLHYDVEVDLEALEDWKRPCRAFVDSVNLGIAQRMTIRASRVAGVQLAFCQSCDLQAKLYKLQFPKH